MEIEMKILSWFIGILFTLLVLVYIVLFTPFGNSLLHDTLEGKIQEQTKLDSKLKTFALSLSDFEILLELNKNNTIHVKGNYSLFSQAFDLHYEVKLEKLASLKPLTQTQLQSSFHTDGEVKGDMKLIKVDGKSDLATSATEYHVVLKDFNPTSIIAKIDDADLNALLYMLNQKAYASAKINVDMNFKNITPHQLDGNILLVTKDGKLNRQVMKKDFNITIAKTVFNMNLDAKLKGDSVDYIYALHSNLAQLSSEGRVTPEPLDLDVKYGVNVKELAVFKPMSGVDIRGPFKLNGTANGTKEKLTVDGKSDLALSATQFHVLLENFAPKSLQATIKHLKLQRALYMLKQPHYTDGLLDVNVDISDADMKHLQGSVKSKISKGKLDSQYLTKAYEFNSTMPTTTFNLATFMTLNKNMVNTKVDLNSNLANLDIKNAEFNMNDASIASDYLVKIHDLNKLFFVTARHLKGSLSANGELNKGKDLDFTAHSNVADGKLDANLHNDDFHATLSSMQTLKVLDMLLYPKIFKSNIDGVVDYNIAQAKGTFNAKLSHGEFTKNQVLDAAKKYASTDLYKEKFKGDVNAKIEKEHILASLDLKSNRSAISTKDTKLNSLTKEIKSKIDINANGNPFIVYLTRTTENPKVTVDANKLIQREATKALQKEATKLLKKQNTKGLEKEAQKLLKGFF